jgi:hypothetical protein
VCAPIKINLCHRPAGFAQFPPHFHFKIKQIEASGYVQIYAVIDGGGKVNDGTNRFAGRLYG